MRQQGGVRIYGSWWSVWVAPLVNSFNTSLSPVYVELVPYVFLRFVDGAVVRTFQCKEQRFTMPPVKPVTIERRG